MNFAPTYGTVFFPYLVRNYLTWLAVNNSEENSLVKAGWGFAAGIAGTIPDTVAYHAIKNAPDLSLKDIPKIVEKVLPVYCQACKTLFNNNPKAILTGPLLTGALCRASGNALATWVLSKDVKEWMVDAQNVVLDVFQSLYSAAQNQHKSLTEKPNISPAAIPNAHNQVTNPASQAPENKGRG